MGKPVVSVIMPAYNGESYIREAIESIQKQTYQDWELIIVEDCSTDRTLSIVEKFLEDKRIKLWKNDRNMGIAASRNKAISISEGIYIAIQDDDDLSLPDRLEKQVQFLDEHNDIDAVAGYWITMDETGEQILGINEGFRNPKYVRAHLLFSDCIGNGSVMFRKEFIRKKNLRYRDNMLGMEDFCFWIEFSKEGNISAINNIVYKHRKHVGQETEEITKKRSQERRELFGMLQRYSLSLSGITLSSQSIDALERLAGEKTDPTIKATDYKDLLLVFREIIEKAHLLKLDYENEIAIACRKLLGKKIANSRGLWD